jgi:carboxylesterase
VAAERTVREKHPVRAGAEQWRHDGGPLGILLVHGFTGSPASLRPAAEWFAQEGVTVLLPRLPGHGTHWEDLAGTSWEDWYGETERALVDISSRCADVTLFALSMGGALAVRLAAAHPDRVRALALVNPFLVDPRPGLGGAILPLLFVRSTKGVINDIKKPGQDEIGYERVPVRVLPSLAKLLKLAQADLPRVRAPLLLFRSPQDHVVKKASAHMIVQRIGSTEKELVQLPNSYHVATLDNDAPMIQERVLAFARAHAHGDDSP